mmetsp:Transcript_127335/g.396338  ORF Transcript_127335/g.396338 Transcript_127335/m.396338 type:complete len:408 (-) Transcript_127335:99-1322(-)
MWVQRWLAFFGRVLVLSSPAAVLQVTAVTNKANSRWGRGAMLDMAQVAPNATGPKLFFLFMVRDKLPSEKVWLRFFGSAARGTEYEALVHCTDETGCRQNIQNQTAFRIVPTVASKWCVDLVSPMNALLSYAAHRGTPGRLQAGHPHDKFIFVSDTTVPVKPFRHVQHVLGVSDGANSTFCIRPWWTWAWHDATDVAVKHDQWLVLSREHVNKALAPKEAPREMLRLLTPLHWANVEWLARGLYNINRMILQRLMSSKYAAWLVGAPHPSGCVDEYWHFATVFGYFDREKGVDGIDVPGLSGGRITMDEVTAQRTQGRCDTYVRFPQDDQFPELTEALQESKDTIWERSKTFKHPGRFDQLSPASLGLLRNSSFLFARKVDADTTFSGGMALDEAFDTFVFSPSPQP